MYGETDSGEECQFQNRGRHLSPRLVTTSSADAIPQKSRIDELEDGGPSHGKEIFKWELIIYCIKGVLRGTNRELSCGHKIVVRKLNGCMVNKTD